jgi:hypothetical protein
MRQCGKGKVRRKEKKPPAKIRRYRDQLSDI